MINLRIKKNISTKNSPKLAIKILIMTHIGLVFYSFSILSLLNEDPIFMVDSAYHWYNIVLSANMIQSGSLIGYDPFFDAGSVAGLPFNASAKLPALIFVLFGGALSAAVVWKIYVFATLILAPVFVLSAALVLRLKDEVSFITSLLAISLLWVSLFQWHIGVGMVSFVFAAYASVLYVCFLVGILETVISKVWLVPVSLFGALFELVHPVFFLPTVVGLFAYLLVRWRHVSLISLLILVVVSVFIVGVINVFWVADIFSDHGYIFPRIHERLLFQTDVDFNLIWVELLGVWGTEFKAYGSKVYPIIGSGILWAVVACRQSKEYWLLVVWIVAGIFLIVYAAIGSTWEVLGVWTQPNRFAPVGYLFLSIPAAFGLCQLVRTAISARGSSGKKWAARVHASALVLVSTFVVYEIAIETSYFPHARYGKQPPRVREIGPYTEYLSTWITENTTPEARILFETTPRVGSNTGGGIYDGAHIAGYLAYTTGREFIGGPYTGNWVTGTTEGKFFGVAVEQITVADLWRYFELFNIGWIIIQSEKSNRYFETIEGLQKAATFQSVTIYKIKREFNYFLKGAGNVSSVRHNEVLLEKVSGAEIILKYHFASGLVSDPPTEIVRHQIAGDSNDFIKILNPPETLRIYMKR